MFVDTHCHVYPEYYSDIDCVVNECMSEGVNNIVVSGCDRKSINQVLDVIKNYDMVYAALGYHPSECLLVNDSDLLEIENYIFNNKKIIGIGEIGLDYHYGKDDKEQQILLFEKQLKLAEKCNLPVVIHSRDATMDTINILKKYKVSGIIHCFSGSYETALEYIKMGFKLGIGGVITFKNSTKLREVVEKIDLSNIVLETDSPYLTPEPFRGKTNSPKNIPIIANKIAIIKGVSVSMVEELTYKNVTEVFNRFNKVEKR